MSKESKGGASNLQELFKSFTGNAAEMDGRQFAKLFKDTN